MKKKNFIDGAIISTLCLIVCKILGLVYVIPFYKIIGSKGGALYSYAYSIYAVFLNLSTVGIPSAIAKIISEYDTLSFKYSLNFIAIYTLVLFLFLLYFHNQNLIIYF